MSKKSALWLATAFLAQSLLAQKRPLPVIDMHLHALHVNDQGPAPLSVGAPFRDLGINDPKDRIMFGSITWFGHRQSLM